MEAERAPIEQEPRGEGGSHSAARTYAWAFQVPPEQEAAFRAAYGPSGDWACLFRRGEGYLGTTLLQDADRPGRYLTLDRWTCAEAHDAFLARHRADYETLDRRCERLTDDEQNLGTFGEVP